MHFLSKELSAVTEADVLRLVAEGIREGKTLEFKQKTPTDQTEEKKEFLNDVCSFANTGGGHIVYGVAEEEGVATEICGIAETDFDALTLKLESSIRDGIEPRVPLIRCRHLTTSAGPTVMILEIGRSWVSPHMVTYKGTSRFFARTSNGKYSLDVQEIRNAFVGAEAVGERLRNFRTDRIAKILSKDVGIDIVGNAVTVLHVLPVSSFAGLSISLDAMQDVKALKHFMPIRATAGCYDRIVFDGFVRCATSQRADRKLLGYVHALRNGCIESVDGAMLSPYQDQALGNFPTGLYEQKVVEALDNYLKYAAVLNFEAPLAIALSVLNVRGFRLTFSLGEHVAQDPVDRDHLILPEVHVDNLEASAAKILKSSFDSIWNACGFPGSQNYDGEGNWIGGNR